MTRWTTALAAAVLAALPATAEERAVRGVADAPLAGISEARTLVRSTRTITACDGGECIDRASDLRVGYVVIDTGSGTDVSPTGEVWLTMFNDVEETATVSAQWRVAQTFRFISFERRSAGRYRLVHEGPNACGLPTPTTVLIDARRASIAVRNGRSGRFDEAVMRDPIFISQTVSPCAGGEPDPKPARPSASTGIGVVPVAGDCNVNDAYVRDLLRSFPSNSREAWCGMAGAGAWVESRRPGCLSPSVEAAFRRRMVVNRCRVPGL